MEKTILNKKLGMLFHVCSITIGIFLIIVFAGFYTNFYNKTNYYSENLIDLYSSMIFCIEGIVVGMILIIINFNFENPIIPKMFWGFCGIVIGSIIWNRTIRFGVILFIVMLIIIFLTFRFKNVFSTVCTMLIVSFGFILIGAAIIQYTNIKNENLVLYVLITLCFIVYRKYGVKINKCFIKHLLGYAHEAELYDVEQLVTQVTFIYLILFICLNVQTYNMEISENTATLINNSFLTGLTIMQIDWNKIVFYFQKKTN